ncbi:hypothetical protein PIROE2DRAFT_7028, partial [Piromyces sp. E2]
ELFKLKETILVDKINEGNVLFLKFGYISNSNPIYTLSPIPGNKKGISGAIISGFNFGINKYINGEQLSAVKKVIKYIISKDIIKKIILETNTIIPIPSFFNDTEINCDLFNNLQYFRRKYVEHEDYDYYSERFRKYAFRYLYDNISIEETVKRINDLEKIYYISFNTDNSIVGLIYGIVMIISDVILMCSIPFLFIKRTKKYFNIFPVELWILLFGSYMINVNSSFLSYGTVTPEKCSLQFNLRHYSLNIIFLIPLYKLIINFPVINKLSENVKKNKDKYVFGIVEVIIEEGENFKKCEQPGILNLGLIAINLVFFDIMIALIFIEWNIIEISNITRLIFGQLCIYWEATKRKTSIINEEYEIIRKISVDPEMYNDNSKKRLSHSSSKIMNLHNNQYITSSNNNI